MTKAVRLGAIGFVAAVVVVGFVYDALRAIDRAVEGAWQR